MENDELKEILEMDFPNVEIDSKKIISACLAREDRHHKQFIRLNIVLSSFIVLVGIIILSVVMMNNNTPIKPNDKIEIVRSSGYVISGNNSLDSTWYIGPYGIEVLIKCDFTKHPKYNEWVEECEPIALEDMNENSDGRFSYEFYLNKQLLKKYYEEIKNDYTNHNGYVLEPYEGGFVRLQFFILPSDGETIEEAIEKNDNYFNDFLKSNEYNNLVELAETNYICSIMIGQMDVSLQGNE